MLVGYQFNSYAEERNIIGIVPDVKYKKVHDTFSLKEEIANKLSRLANEEVLSSFNTKNPRFDYYYQFDDFDLNQVSLLHFFNTISYGSTPWITTFETYLPRFACLISYPHTSKLESDFSALKAEVKIHKAFKALSGNACHRIIAMSDCNANRQTMLLKKFPEYQESIQSKLIVMHPPQRLLNYKYEDKQLSLDEKIRFLFVGSSFFRKGGQEIIETFKYLKDEYKYNFELTIVSSFVIDYYAIKNKKTPADVERTKHLIQQNSDWINYFPRLPNQEVLELMKKSHIGLLPTYADTYGYSVLEFQAAGCPVITTNIRALPEINDNNVGWIIEIPKDSLGEAIYTTKEGGFVISKLIRKGIEQAVHEIFADRKVILDKSNRSISRIIEHHSIEDYASRLKNIYLEAIRADKT
ncbi:glycosyltransferase family 4 protein [Nostoc sp. LPT]|uniref:glycosyltransferase family 4 protein n=1 Tax=Nostoc sp. LPT TaxID=2815387 RepID=UPI001DA86FBF|nr:glycosyltransferase family 4 protein [Nostoc sp. LPT]MBN4003203.1 glycosyltransferase family 4 protein [Nostoc sp. LPT]